MYENKIKRLKEYYLEEIRERNEKLDVIFLCSNYINYLFIIIYIISES